MEVILEILLGLLLAVGMGLAFICLVLIGIVGFFIGGFPALFLTSRFYVLRMMETSLHVWDDNSDEPAYVFFFFGPAQRQAWNAFRAVLQSIRPAADKFCGTLKNELDKLRLTSSDVIEHIAKAFLRGMIGGVWFFSFMLCFPLTVLIYLLYSLLLLIVTFPLMTVASIARFADWIYLHIHRIFAVCPVHKQRYTIPAFSCPNASCRKVHKALVPNRYGIFHHRCVCGRRIGSTLLTGRSSLESSCPLCAAKMISANAAPIYYHLVGAPNAGKTTFLSAFIHLFLKRLRENLTLEVEIVKDYVPYFDQLEQYYQGTVPVPSTSDQEAQIYPISVSGGDLKVTQLPSIYDVSGELFTNSNADRQAVLEYMRNCRGIMFIIDPFVRHGKLWNKRFHSDEAAAEPINQTAVEFLRYLIELDILKPTQKSNTPVAILISKADDELVAAHIGDAALNNFMQQEPERFQNRYQYRDELCRRFLQEFDLYDDAKQLEARFSNIRLFPVSAMGHEANNEAFHPWGIDEVMEWMLSKTASSLWKQMKRYNPRSERDSK